jgi:hypothetical protein
MPIDTKHPRYEAMIEAWKKCRDCYEGEEIIKREGTLYLPKTHDSQSGSSYLAYKARAAFWDFTDRAVKGLAGAALRKNPHISMPDGLNSLIDKESLRWAATELLVTGRFGLLVDMPAEGGEPYLARYRAEQIINWRVDDNGEPLWVVLMEQAWQPKEDDPFELELTTRYRLLHLVDGAYVQTVFTEQKDERGNKELVPGESIIPLSNGTKLSSIPFFIGGPEGIDWDVVKPIILGLANANLRHYRLDADHAHNLHMSALATPWLNGFNKHEIDDLRKRGVSFELGSGKAWALPTGATAGMLETSGRGLLAQQREKDAAEKRMAVLGARIIEGQRVGVEAAETARIRQAGEASLLASLVSSVGKVFSEAARFAAVWTKRDQDEVVLELNQDFVSTRLTPSEAEWALKALMNNRISYDTFWYILQTGELVPESVDAEAELQRIEARAAKQPGEASA